jgi:hypothetical protein
MQAKNIGATFEERPSLNRKDVCKELRPIKKARNQSAVVHGCV